MSTGPLAFKRAVPLASPSAFGGGVSARVVSITAKSKVAAKLPGEVAGPGVAVTVRITNASHKTVALGAVVVELDNSSKAPADPMTAAPARPFSGSLAPGRSATAVYVFTIARSERKPVTVRVSYNATKPAVVFTGNAA